ncbi:aminoacyl tRNA synthase complex-interacting multifunctional protein 2 isoform X1 [Diaphorina citri]|uniref:Aminoacyl tRNA synthase complex-interacting multifunctional protein 2 isoform X1 n=1 Tax=Diaphorina citri TaxID=121845 RepID=A0A1S4EDJ0_DIACI|nr:aminoacyl tRNA synthase complex-interacting multifunctional protein 2 isoform X2 [Diaphorina citri]XP_017300233.1 aminoacyl tRNA synthase complex-interacting multifunctional protein 2 isoform X1 [Diaphorina citri]
MTLNGPSKIYHLKPVFHLPDQLEPKTSMYKMKNLHQEPVSSMKVSQDKPSETNSHESKIISEVLKRQEELIKHLQNIQTKVTDLKLELTNASSSSKPSAAKSEKPTGSAQAKPPKKQVLKSQNNNISSPSEPQINTQNIVVKDLVLNLSPHRPAYSLLTLQHIWPNQFSSNYTTHVHSSVDHAPKAFSLLSSNKGNQENAPFNMRLIWKDVPDTEVISSPIKQTPLLGEVSMLRLFQRMLCGNQLNIEQLTEIDSALDTCVQLLYTTQKHTALSLVKKLSELLGSNEWMLASSGMSIVDAAAWSAILNSSVQLNQLSPNLSKWCQKINSLVGLTNEMIAKK